MPAMVMEGGSTRTGVMACVGNGTDGRIRELWRRRARLSRACALLPPARQLGQPRLLSPDSRPANGGLGGGVLPRPRYHSALRRCGRSAAAPGDARLVLAALAYRRLARGAPDTLSPPTAGR